MRERRAEIRCDASLIHLLTRALGSLTRRRALATGLAGEGQLLDVIQSVQ